MAAFLHNGWNLSIRMSFYWIPRMPGYITCVIIKTSPSSSKHQDFYKMVSGTVVNLFRIKKINNPCKHFKSLERPSVIVNQFHTLTTRAEIFLQKSFYSFSLRRHQESKPKALSSKALQLRELSDLMELCLPRLRAMHNFWHIWHNVKKCQTGGNVLNLWFNIKSRHFWQWTIKSGSFSPTSTTILQKNTVLQETTL